MTPETTPLFTANNVDLYVNGQAFGFCQNITISRNVNRQPRYAVGTPIYKDAPVSTASVTVQITNMVPVSTLTGQTALQNSGGNAVTNSLASLVGQKPFTASVNEATDSAGTALYSVENCQYNNDSVAVPAGDIVAYNLSLIAPDTSVWQI